MADILRSLVGAAGTFVFTWILPSALGVGAFTLFVFPSISHLPVATDITNLDEAQTLLLMAFASLGLGVLLAALSTPLYRILEGYYWPRRLDRFRGWRIRRHLGKRLELKMRVEAMDVGWQQALEAEKLQRYPVDDAQIVPTRLGNALRALETYGSNRFSLDSQTLWTELEAVVPEPLRKEVEHSRASVDFLVGLLWLTMLFGVASLGSGLLISFGPEPLGMRLVASGAVTFALVPVWYRMAVATTSYWSSSVQALVNLGRKELAAAMALRMPETLDEERRMWEFLSMFVYYPHDRYWSWRLDEFRTPGQTQKAIARAFIEEVINRGNLEWAGELVTFGMLDHRAVPAHGGGLAGLLDHIRMVRGAFPDIQVSIASMLEEGDKVVIRWVASGTHQGPFLSEDATGRRVSFEGIDFLRFQGGKIVERWGLADCDAVLRQLQH